MTEDGEGTEFAEGVDALAAFVAARAKNADERDTGGFGGERVVNIVAEVDGRLGRATGENFEQALRVGFRAGDVIGGDDAAEIFASFAAVEGVRHFVPNAAGEDSEFRFFCEALQAGARQKPFLASDEAIAIRSPIDFEEPLLHFCVLLLAAKRLDPSGRKFPIVVIAGKILPFVKLLVSDALAGEMADGLEDRFVKGFVDVDEDAIDIENDNFREFPDPCHPFLRERGSVPIFSRTPFRGVCVRLIVAHAIRTPSVRDPSCLLAANARGAPYGAVVPVRYWKCTVNAVNLRLTRVQRTYEEPIQRQEKQDRRGNLAAFA